MARSVAMSDRSYAALRYTRPAARVGLRDPIQDISSPANPLPTSTGPCRSCCFEDADDVRGQFFHREPAARCWIRRSRAGSRRGRDGFAPASGPTHRRCGRFVPTAPGAPRAGPTLPSPGLQPRHSSRPGHAAAYAERDRPRGSAPRQSRRPTATPTGSAVAIDHSIVRARVGSAYDDSSNGGGHVGAVPREQSPCQGGTADHGTKHEPAQLGQAEQDCQRAGEHEEEAADVAADRDR